jgi:hypothetical protein
MVETDQHVRAVVHTVAQVSSWVVVAVVQLEVKLKFGRTANLFNFVSINIGKQKNSV